MTIGVMINNEISLHTRTEQSHRNFPVASCYPDILLCASRPPRAMRLSDQLVPITLPLLVTNYWLLITDHGLLITELNSL